MGIAAFLAALTVATNVIVPASAAGSPPGAGAVACDPQQDPNRCRYLFLYPQSGFKGTPQQVDAPAGSCIDTTVPLKRGARSVRNRMIATAAILFSGRGCTGASYRVGAGTSDATLQQVSFDAVASVKVVEDECAGKVPKACVFTGVDYSGQLQAFSEQTDGTCLPLASPLAGKVRSVVNRLYVPKQLQQDILLFGGTNCTGESWRTNAATGHPELAVFGYADKAQSIKFVKDPCLPHYGQAVCLWTDTMYDGAVQILGPEPAGTCVNLRPEIRGQVSSLRQWLYRPQEQDVALYSGDG